MPVIAIEGLDGSGKTTIAHLLGTAVKCPVVEKPLRWLLQHEYEQELRSYNDVVHRVNALQDPVCRQWFYALGWLLVGKKYRNQLVVVDRYMVSGYSYNASGYFESIWQMVTDIVGPPFLTVLLEVNEHERKRRLEQRTGESTSEAELAQGVERARMMHDYLHSKDWPQLILATDILTPERVTARIMERLQPMLQSLNST